MVKLITIELDNTVYIVDSSESVMGKFLASSSTAGTTMHNMSNGANYSVPSGETFKILLFRFRRSTGSVTVSVYQSNTADSQVGEVDKIVIEDNSSLKRLANFGQSNEPTIAATRFLTTKMSTLTGSMSSFIIYGVEDNL